MNMNWMIRAASVAAMMLTGSCTSPFSNSPYVTVDPDIAHPISVEPSYQSLKLPVSSAAVGLMPDDEARFMDFVQNYMAHGNGAISVSVPDGPGSQGMIHYFGNRLADMGIIPSRILVGTHDGGGSVELGYVHYEARVDACGDWSDNVADTASNLNTKNFGCAVQHNIAAMVSDPRDLDQSRPLGTSDAMRRTDVLGKYEKGQVTQADKHKSDAQNEQSGAGSDMGK